VAFQAVNVLFADGESYSGLYDTVFWCSRDRLCSQADIRGYSGRCQFWR